MKLGREDWIECAINTYVVVCGIDRAAARAAVVKLLKLRGNDDLPFAAILRDLGDNDGPFDEKGGATLRQRMSRWRTPLTPSTRSQTAVPPSVTLK